MTLKTALRIHRVTAPAAIVLLVLFWSSTVAVELWGDPTAIAGVKRAILFGVPAMVALLAATAGTGHLMARRYRRTPELAAKLVRMPLIAANGLLVLVPSAVALDYLAQRAIFDRLFYTVQAIELAAGMLNLWLLLLMVVDGRRMASSRSTRLDVGVDEVLVRS